MTPKISLYFLFSSSYLILHHFVNKSHCKLRRIVIKAYMDGEILEQAKFVRRSLQKQLVQELSWDDKMMKAKKSWPPQGVSTK